MVRPPSPVAPLAGLSRIGSQTPGQPLSVGGQIPEGPVGFEPTTRGLKVHVLRPHIVLKSPVPEPFDRLI